MKIASLETDFEERQRSQKLKSVLKTLLKETDKKIALIGHGGMFAIIVSN